jgi:hypothetical protein
MCVNQLLLFWSSFERRLLKQIQGLTDRCPTIAVYSLLGAIPITTQIEKNTLTTFYNIATNKEFVECTIQSCDILRLPYSALPSISIW